MRIDIRDQIMGDDAVDCGVMLVHEEVRNGVDRWWRAGRGTGSRRRRRLEVNTSHSVFIDNDHWRRFVGGDQIVQDEIFVALVTPAGFIFAVTVLQV